MTTISGAGGLGTILGRIFGRRDGGRRSAARRRDFRPEATGLERREVLSSVSPFWSNPNWNPMGSTIYLGSGNLTGQIMNGGGNPYTLFNNPFLNSGRSSQQGGSVTPSGFGLGGALAYPGSWGNVSPSQGTSATAALFNMANNPWSVPAPGSGGAPWANVMASFNQAMSPWGTYGASNLGGGWGSGLAYGGSYGSGYIPGFTVGNPGGATSLGL